MDRHAKFVWMKEVLEHLHDCHREWEVAEGKAERFLAESMKRDLDEVRRICESLTGRAEGGRNGTVSLVERPS
jgi:hypothetical protein